MELPEKYLILDIRNEKEFNEKTICGYLKKDVTNIFNKSLSDGKIEMSCNWAIELLCSGYINKIYDKFYLIIIKNIHINNLDLLEIYYSRFIIYDSLSKRHNKLEMRNIQNIRNHIVELCTRICLSHKVKAYTSVNITDEMFKMEFIKCKLCADRDDYINKYFRYGDPVELKIFLNEFVYALLNTKYELCLFWLFWLFEWEKKNIKRDKEYQCGYRNIEGIDKKFMTNMVWIIWEILLNINNNTYINTLYNLYRHEFSSSKKQKKLPIIIFGIKLYTDSKYMVSARNESHKSVVIQVCGNVNNLFIERKKNEIVDKRDDVHAKNLTNYNKSKKDSLQNNHIKEKSNVKINAISELDSLMLNNLSK